eukprot:GAHX01004521.1.p1 GENE.GAHX01004521.1~~GAHX01004521.1.p1  ORF type:complete len:58 (+),score=4.30 GAHX01004521.1:105-278(+)
MKLKQNSDFEKIIKRFKTSHPNWTASPHAQKTDIPLELLIFRFSMHKVKQSNQDTMF